MTGTGVHEVRLSNGNRFLRKNPVRKGASDALAAAVAAAALATPTLPQVRARYAFSSTDSAAKVRSVLNANGSELVGTTEVAVTRHGQCVEVQWCDGAGVAEVADRLRSAGGMMVTTSNDTFATGACTTSSFLMRRRQSPMAVAVASILAERASGELVDDDAYDSAAASAEAVPPWPEDLEREARVVVGLTDLSLEGEGWFPHHELADPPTWFRYSNETTRQVRAAHRVAGNDVIAALLRN